MPTERRNREAVWQSLEGLPPLEQIGRYLHLTDEYRDELGLLPDQRVIYDALKEREWKSLMKRAHHLEAEHG